jgi:hypothetical protein
MSLTHPPSSLHIQAAILITRKRKKEKTNIEKDILI